MFWLILGVLIGLTINIVLCLRFAEFAEEKGYHKGKYFWMCFFLGVIGFAWVAALPDLTLQERLSKIEGSLHTTINTVANNKFWICGNCKAKNSSNYGQCRNCGTYRR